jgi:Zn-dependent protease
MNLKGAIRLFRLWGIDVFLHWSWIIVAALEIQHRRGEYTSVLWNILEYVSLFGIVTMHEFGHALACKSVGGIANQIVLWPLGGIAFVQPPQRAGAYLWSIVAGPLVNVILVPVLIGSYLIAKRLSVPPDALHYIWNLFAINALLLVFNMLPIFPLDGGQVLRAIFWFFMGPVRSLQVSSVLGIVSVIGCAILITLRGGDFWLYLICAFAATRCLAGLRQAKLIQQQESQEPLRRPQMRCPACGQAAPIGNFWRCTCGQPFDTFQTGGVCPKCGTQHHVTVCPDCRQPSPLAAWYGQMGSFPVVFSPPPVFNSAESPPRSPEAPL